MKNLLQAILLVIAIFFQSILFAQINPKNYWEGLDSLSGLVSNTVNDVLIESKSKVWIGTDRGLSLYDGNTITNFTNSNSGLANNNVRELTLAQGKLWMATDSGLSSFNGTSFANFTTAQGLISNSIAGLTATSTDTLWIGTQSGTSKFDGTSFTNYSSMTGRSIAVDSLDRVYLLIGPIDSRYDFVRLYENGSWSTPSPTGDSLRIGTAKLVLAEDGSLYGAPQNGPDTYVKISYPLNVERYDVFVDGKPAHQFIGATNMQAFEKGNGQLWVGSSIALDPFLLSGTDSILTNHFVSKLRISASSVDIFKDLIVVGTNNGVYFANTAVKGSNAEGESISTNEIKTSIKSTEALFSSTPINVSNNFEFPKNSGSNAIYSSNFIVAAKKATQTNFNVYPLQGWYSAFIPGPIRNTAGVTKEYMVKVSRQEIEDHKLNFNQSTYSIPDGIKNWPAFGDTTLGIAKDLAPFVDANSNGCYDPENGDYPIIKGDEAIYWINHPENKNLKLEYHWMMYAFNDSARQYLNQSLFVQYTIINRDVSAYDSVKVGMFVDGDLGNPSDDFVGCDSINNIFYTYNGDLFDEAFQGNTGYGNNTPALGVKFLSDSLTNALYYNNGTATNGDPTNAKEWLNYMNSRWRNGQQVKYGGNGFNTADVTTIPTNYMFSGNPYTQVGWSEVNPGPTEQRNNEGDRRFFGSMPYFALQPSERKTIEVVVGYGMTPDTTTQVGQNIAEMISVLNASGDYNDTITLPNSDFAKTDSCNKVTSINEIDREQLSSTRFFPNPTNGKLQITSAKSMVQLKVFDMKGAKIYAIYPASKSYQLDLESLNKGVYIIRVLDEDGKWENEKIILR